MNFENAFEVLFFGVFAAVVGSFLFRMLKHGGFKSAMFGAPIQNTLGEAAGAGKLMNVAVKVHVLQGAPEKAVGLEFVTKTIASYQMVPVTLSLAEAKKLISLLQSATNVR